MDKKFLAPEPGQVNHTVHLDKGTQGKGWVCWWRGQGGYDKYSCRDSIFTPEIVQETVQ